MKLYDVTGEEVVVADRIPDRYWCVPVHRLDRAGHRQSGNNYGTRAATLNVRAAFLLNAED